jgi:hypothetical protein
MHEVACRLAVLGPLRVVHALRQVGGRNPELLGEQRYLVVFGDVPGDAALPTTKSRSISFRAISAALAGLDLRISSSPSGRYTVRACT